MSLCPPYRLLRYLEVDAAVAAASPALRHVKLLSLGSYLASLHVKGTVSWERLLVTAADRHGLSAVLPLAMFLPGRFKADSCAYGLLSSFPSLAASRLASTTLSTLDIAAFNQTVHLFVAEQRRLKAVAAAADSSPPAPDGMPSAAELVAVAELAATPPLEILCRGENEPAEGCILAGATSPLLLTRERVLQLAGIPAAQAGDDTLPRVPDPRPISPLLPELYFGNHGLHMTHSLAGAATCRLMASVANRLAANALPSLHAAAPGLLPDSFSRPPPQQSSQQPQPPQQQQRQQQPFSVCLEEGGPLLTSVEDLAVALVDSGHTVQLRLASNLTSFGIGLCVRSGGGGTDGGDSWQQVPLAYPLRCSGLYAVSIQAKLGQGFVCCDQRCASQGCLVVLRCHGVPAHLPACLMLLWLLPTSALLTVFSLPPP